VEYWASIGSTVTYVLVLVTQAGALVFWGKYFTYVRICITCDRRECVGGVTARNQGGPGEPVIYFAPSGPVDG